MVVSGGSTMGGWRQARWRAREGLLKFLKRAEE